MKRIYLFLIATSVYAFFLVRGLPSHHYLDWTMDFKIGDSLEIIILIVPLVYFSLKLLSNKRDFLKDSIWFAFFNSVPFLIYDFLYLGVMKNYGLNYFQTFWYLTIFYFVVLIEIPLIGYLMQEGDRDTAKKHLAMLTVAIILWGLNWGEGLFSNHFLSWQLNMKIIHLTNMPIILLVVVFVFLKLFSEQASYLKDAGFFTVYLSFVFILFDYYYLGFWKGYGMGYIQTYWFTTLFYPLFWIETPLIGRLMQQRPKLVPQVA